MTPMNSQPQFFVGQIVHHKKFDYRGVVIDVDAEFSGTEEWYRQVALSRPPKDKPWYHVLVDNSAQMTYVAERHLEQDPSKAPIDHPAIDVYFEGFENGVYTLGINRQ
jgi:heat shock protein HspQ